MIMKKQQHAKREFLVK